MLHVAGVFEAWHYCPKGRLLWKDIVRNSVTNTALTSILDGFFSGGTVGSSWFLGLIDNASFTALSAADTISSHSGWTESTAYTSATRPAWGHGAASSKMVQNATLVTFTFNASATLKGIFLANNSTKGGSTGLLWATAAFSANRSVVSGGTLPLRYRVIAAAGGT